MDDAQLVVSELATNVVLHAHTDFEVTVTLLADTVLLAVADGSISLPTPRPTPRAGHGHGLTLVASVAERCGTRPDVDGKVVWAELRRRSDRPMVLTG